jgi:hypothetical protein
VALDRRREARERTDSMSATVGHQVHSKFKLFAGSLSPDGSIGALAKEVEAFAKTARAASKSIGIEYVEHTKQVLLSLGYRDDEPGYEITLHSVSLGKLAGTSADELAKAEEKMGEAADKVEKLICHELLVTDTNELIMVFMAHG